MTVKSNASGYPTGTLISRECKFAWNFTRSQYSIQRLATIDNLGKRASHLRKLFKKRVDEMVLVQLNATRVLWNFQLASSALSRVTGEDTFT